MKEEKKTITVSCFLNIEPIYKNILEYFVLIISTIKWSIQTKIITIVNTNYTLSLFFKINISKYQKAELMSLDIFLFCYYCVDKKVLLPIQIIIIIPINCLFTVVILTECAIKTSSFHYIILSIICFFFAFVPQTSRWIFLAEKPWVPGTRVGKLGFLGLGFLRFYNKNLIWMNPEI